MKELSINNSQGATGRCTGCYLACMLCPSYAGSLGTISVQGFLPYHKTLHRKRGVGVSNCPLFSCLSVSIPL